jgi:hypothetical protein
MGYELNSTCIVKLDCNNGKITYVTRHGERECDIVIDKNSFYYPAIDSDENGHYKIERIGKAKGKNTPKKGVQYFTLNGFTRAYAIDSCLAPVPPLQSISFGPCFYYF